MSAQPFVLAPADYPRALNVVGESITVLASGDVTGGYEIFFQKGPEGSGPPPHSHPWDESFYVVSGELAFGIGEKALTAGPGTLVHLPAGTVHWFRFGPGGGEMVSMTSQLGASQMFTDFDREITPDKPELDKLVELGATYGLNVAG